MKVKKHLQGFGAILLAVAQSYLLTKLVELYAIKDMSDFEWFVVFFLVFISSLVGEILKRIIAHNVYFGVDK